MTDIAATTEAQIVDAVEGARDWKSPLNIVGNRTKRSFGRPVANWGTVLDVSGLKGIVDYKPEELIITAKPGTPVAEITAALAEKNQRLGFDPPDLGPLFGAPANTGTIGGAISCDLAGPAAMRYGRARDHLLGIRAVNGYGEAFKAGGKVVKNVTGFDIPKLFCGAFGTFGVLTEVTLRVFPKSTESALLTVGPVSIEDGFTLLRRIWNSPLEPTALILLSGKTCARIPKFHHAMGAIVANRSTLATDPRSPCMALIRIEASAASLRDKLAVARSLLDAQAVIQTEDVTLLDDISALTSFVGGIDDIWLTYLPPAEAPHFSRLVETDDWIADWAGGKIWTASTPGVSEEDRRRQYGGIVEQTNILVRASDETRTRVAPFPPLSPERLALTRAVKAAFDPLGLFNPGRMYSDI